VWSLGAHTLPRTNDGRRTKENKHMTLAEELNPRASAFGSQESQSAILDLNPEDLFAFRFECSLVEFSRPEYEVIDPVPIMPIELTRDTFRPRSTDVVLVRPWNRSLHSSSFVNDSHLPSTKQVPSTHSNHIAPEFDLSIGKCWVAGKFTLTKGNTTKLESPLRSDRCQISAKYFV
jgi:hypothetical protein